MQIHGYSHNCWKGFDDWHSAQAWLTEGATQQQITARRKFMSDCPSDSLVPCMQKARRQVLELTRLKQTIVKRMSW